MPKHSMGTFSLFLLALGTLLATIIAVPTSSPPSRITKRGLECSVDTSTTPDSGIPDWAQQEGFKASMRACLGT
ncbi:MAG: hypothetical protein Q9186_007519, partial [Xanthomendoza sp. 1 TL-2023]